MSFEFSCQGEFLYSSPFCKSSPLKFKSPFISSVAVGLVVPMPTLPNVPAPLLEPTKKSGDVAVETYH